MSENTGWEMATLDEKQKVIYFFVGQEIHNKRNSLFMESIQFKALYFWLILVRLYEKRLMVSDLGSETKGSRFKSDC